MKIICKKEDLIKQGVYVIKCIKNNKIYIGSTTVSFIKRYNHHLSQLKRNNHKNQYLQNSYNKYGEEFFEFDILQICNKIDCLIIEQKLIDTYKCIDKSIGFNINPLASGTPNLSKETIKKRSISNKKFLNECSVYFNQLQQNSINFEDIPKKFQKTIKYWKSENPWNKNKKYISTDHLKVSKTITPLLKQSWKNTSKRAREKYPKINVFDENMNFLGCWESAKDLEDFSKTSKNTLPIKSRFSVKKNGIPIKVLQSANINKSCKNNKKYKNLYFKYFVPDQEEILELESSNIGEF